MCWWSSWWESEGVDGLNCVQSEPEGEVRVILARLGARDSRLENQEIQETLKKVKTYDLSFETQDLPCHSYLYLVQDITRLTLPAASSPTPLLFSPFSFEVSLSVLLYGQANPELGPGACSSYFPAFFVNQT